MKEIKEPCDSWCNAPYEVCRCCVLGHNKSNAVECKDCKTKYLIEEGDVFCTKCGARLVDA